MVAFKDGESAESAFVFYSSKTSCGLMGGVAGIARVSTIVSARKATFLEIHQKKIQTVPLPGSSNP
jgi:hypothetical protein